MIREAAKPPSHASGGTTVAQPLVWAYTDVDSDTECNADDAAKEAEEGRPRRETGCGCVLWWRRDAA